MLLKLVARAARIEDRNRRTKQEIKWLIRKNEASPQWMKTTARDRQQGRAEL